MKWEALAAGRMQWSRDRRRTKLLIFNFNLKFYSLIQHSVAPLWYTRGIYSACICREERCCARWTALIRACQCGGEEFKQQDPSSFFFIYLFVCFRNTQNINKILKIYWEYFYFQQCKDETQSKNRELKTNRENNNKINKSCLHSVVCSHLFCYICWIYFYEDNM